MIIKVMIAVMGASLLFIPTSTKAEGCPNEQLRATDGYALNLPDCRSYEQVSPVGKNLADAEGKGDYVQSLPTGEGVTFFSFTPFPGIAGTAEEFPTYLGTREGDRWGTQGLLPPTAPGANAGVVGLTEDLAVSVIYSNEPALIEPGAVPGQETYYIRRSDSLAYQLLVRDPSGEPLFFADATVDDSRILFESKAALTANAVLGVTNLYEWDEGTIRLVGVPPDENKTPEGGAVAGPGGPAIGEEERGEFPARPPGGASSASQFYTQHIVSETGTRLFFTDVVTGQIYMREPERGRTISVSKGPAYWRAATPSGQYVFYTEGQATKRKLYRFDVENDKLEVLTGVTEEPDVLGTLGVSNDGSYAYFVARVALPGVGENSENVSPKEGDGNLYVWHEGHTTSFVADLGDTGGQIEENESDWTDMANTVPGPAQGGKSSRVTPEGTRLLFSANNELMGYHNEGNVELYLYGAATGRLMCVSCAPFPATAGTQLTDHNSFAPGVRNAVSPRNLSTNGGRVFFQTTETLVPRDTNGKLDVYEWEEGGEGTCPSGRPLGCVYLISTGQSSSESYLGDADLTGNNIFFFTRQPLVSQDVDFNVDVYDARVDGGLAEQNAQSSASCSTGEACRDESTSLPVLGAPASVVFPAEGDILRPPIVPPKKAKPKSMAKKRAVHGKRKRRNAGSKTKGKLAGEPIGMHGTRRRYHT
jgi:hypothetical protein